MHIRTGNGAMWTAQLKIDHLFIYFTQTHSDCIMFVIVSPASKSKCSLSDLSSKDDNA